MTKAVTILLDEPTIIPMAQMALMPAGVSEMLSWVATHRPECVPEGEDGKPPHWSLLFPHDMNDQKHRSEGAGFPSRKLSDNELLVELAGRKCYDSFGLKAGRKSNADYIANTQQGDIPHSSIIYHAKMTFFFAGISRRVSHELIRNYVGSDRDEEGSPSQESTRFTHHYGFFIMPPRYIGDSTELGGTHLGEMRALFQSSMQTAYDNYLRAIHAEVTAWERVNGKAPTSIDKKRIYEAASSFLPHQAETSFIWTTNPAAIAKLVRERANNAADLEIQRFAKKLRRVAKAMAPNLFPQPWMTEEA